MAILTDIKPTTETVVSPVKTADAAPLPADAVKAADEVVVDPAVEALAKAPFTDAKQLKLAEGFNLDPVAVETISKIGLTAAQAQALVDYQAGSAKAQADARAAAVVEASKASIAALKADKDIGGAKFEASMATAQKTLVRFGGPINPATGRGELVDALDSMQLADGSMLGDSPVLAKFLVNVGAALKEDGVGGALGSPTAKTAGNDEGTFLRQLYTRTTALKFPGS